MKVLGMRTVLGVAKSHENQERPAAAQRRVDGVSSMMVSRAKLMRTAPGLRSPSWSAPIMPTVSGLEGTCRVR